MNHDHNLQPGQSTAPLFWRSRYGLELVLFGAIAAYFLLSEHRAHPLGTLPYLLLLACPLMYLFMHHGHGGHAGHGRHAGPGEKLAAPAKSGQPSQEETS